MKIISFSSIRQIVCSCLISFFGYIFPALSSAKAIVTKDDDGLVEWLTYWSVFSLFYFLETLIDFALYRFVPFYLECKICIVLWLTLPKYQGAFRIYNYLIRPYFDEYEADIDNKIHQVSEEVKVKAARHLQFIIWQLFMSPDDGLISSSMRTILSNQNIRNLYNSASNLTTTKSILNDSDKSTFGVINKSQFSKQVLFDFIRLLEEGIYLNIQTTTSSTIYSTKLSVNTFMAKCSLNKGVFLCFQSASKHYNDELSPLEPLSYLIPIRSIQHVLQDTSTSTICQVFISSLSTSSLPNVLYITAEDELQSELLVTGLQLLSLDMKNRIFSNLDRFVGTLAKAQYECLLSKYFLYWKHENSTR